MAISKLVKLGGIMCIFVTCVIYLYMFLSKLKEGDVMLQNAPDIKETFSYFPTTRSLNEFHNYLNTTFDLKKRFHFLSGYKNPCWFEPVPNDYDIIEKERRVINDLRFDFTNFINYGLLKRHFKNKRMSGEKNPQQIFCLPYFLQIGVSKSGTTDLFYRIVEHPQIAVPTRKETQYWSRHMYSDKINTTFQDYALFFEQAAIEIVRNVERINGTDYYPMVTGEGTPTTGWLASYWDRYPGNENLTEPLITTAHLVRDVLPDVKLIVIFRNPVERMLSGYLFFNRNETKSADSFHQQVKHSIALYTNCMSRYSIRRCFYNNSLADTSKLRLRAGMYSVFMKDWFDIFPRNRFLIVRTEDYSKYPAFTLDKIYRFLQLKKLSNEDLDRIARARIINKGRTSIKPYNKTLQMLEKFYAPFKRELAYILNDSRYLW